MPEYEQAGPKYEEKTRDGKPADQSDDAASRDGGDGSLATEDLNLGKGEQLDRLKEQAAKFERLAEAGPGQGGFAISPDGAKALKEACDFFIQGWEQHRRDARRVMWDLPKVGSSPYAKLVAEFNKDVWDGNPEKSMIAAGDRMFYTMQKFKASLEKAEKQYNETDEDNNVSMTKLLKGLE